MIRGVAGLAFACAALATTGCVRARGSPPPVVLLTAFEPFAGAATNASWEAIRELEGTTLPGHRVAVLRLPVVYDGVDAPLRAAIESHRPRAVISFGVGTRVVQVERVARNGYGGVWRDEAGKAPPREAIVPGGPATLATGLPVDAILAALAKEGIGAASSDEAGGFLCNECFYRLESVPRAGAGAGISRRGFVHVPAVGTPDPAGGTFTLERLRRAVAIVVETTLSAPPDVSPTAPR
jgi:pyroglutamyl-peptidase